MKQMEHSYKGEEKFLVNDLKTIVSKARSKAFAAVNYSLVERNWRIGKRIVEEEQNGEARAEYGKHIIEVASAALTEEFGKGFSETNIRTFRKFFLIFRNLERGCVISLWCTLFVFSPFPRYGIEKNVFIYNKAQTFTSSGFVFPQKKCIFAENFFKYGKDTNKI